MQRLIGGRRQQRCLASRHACFFISLWVPIAAAGSPTVNAYFARYDRDGDGRVSLLEYQAYLARGFEQMDRNRDGRIERSEWPQPGRHELSRAQHLGHLAAVFHRQDANGDGFLDLAEFAAPPR